MAPAHIHARQFQLPPLPAQDSLYTVSIPASQAVDKATLKMNLENYPRKITWHWDYLI